MRALYPDAILLNTEELEPSSVRWFGELRTTKTQRLRAEVELGQPRRDTHPLAYLQIAAGAFIDG